MPINTRNPKITELLPHGTVFIAYRQTAGRGRGPNVWVSPKGCLQFSLIIHHDELSTLPTVQHLFALSIVESLRNRPGYHDLPFRIKWPNDIYVAYPGYAIDTTHPCDYLKKLGGILITSSAVTRTSQSDNGDVSSLGFRLIIGCGLNVDNIIPTDSLNHVIEQHNLVNGISLSPLSLEEVLAGIITTFGEMHAILEHERSFSPFRDLYHTRWLHSNQLVNLVELSDSGPTITIPTDASPCFGRVLGIGIEGFLMVQVDDKTIVEVQPDGNSFDVFHRLVKIRRFQVPACLSSSVISG